MITVCMFEFPIEREGLQGAAEVYHHWENCSLHNKLELTFLQIIHLTPFFFFILLSFVFIYLSVVYIHSPIFQRHYKSYYLNHQNYSIIYLKTYQISIIVYLENKSQKFVFVYLKNHIFLSLFLVLTKWLISGEPYIDVHIHFLSWTPVYMTLKFHMENVKA